MRRVVIHRPGGYDRLTIEDAPDPQPGPGEIAVDVEAVGVNYADCVVRMGLYSSAKKYVGWPITPGFEVAGADKMAVTRFGGYATRVVVPDHQVFPIPPQLDPVTAAGFPTVFLTAYYAMFELARPRPGARILVHSAAGGVGGALVQLGKIAGCEVVGAVGSAHKLESVPADRVTLDPWEHAPYDAVFDANGVSTLKRSYDSLKPTGRLVVYGFHSMLKPGKPNKLRLAWNYLRTPRFDPLKMTSDNRSVMAFNLSYLFDQREFLTEAMGRLFGWLAEGKLRAPPVTTYAFDEVATAHRDLESRQTVGKLVLTV